MEKGKDNRMGATILGLGCRHTTPLVENSMDNNVEAEASQAYIGFRACIPSVSRE